MDIMNKTQLYAAYNTALRTQTESEGMGKGTLFK